MHIESNFELIMLRLNCIFITSRSDHQKMVVSPKTCSSCMTPSSHGPCVQNKNAIPHHMPHLDQKSPGNQRATQSSKIWSIVFCKLSNFWTMESSLPLSSGIETDTT